MAKAHIGTTIDEALNSQTLQGNNPSDFLGANDKAINSALLDGLDSTQFLRRDVDATINASLIVDTNMHSDGFYVTRSGHILDEYVKHSVGDGDYVIHYNNDESASSIKWVVENTDTEANAGAGANTQNLELHGSQGGALFTLNGSEILNGANLALFHSTASASGTMSASDKSKLDGIQASAINQATADGRFVQLTGSNMTGDLTWDASQVNKGIVFGSVATQKAYIKQHNTAGQLLIGSDNEIEIRETDGDVMKFNFSTNSGQFQATGKILEQSQLLEDRYAPLSHVGTGGASHAVASTSMAGFLSSGDKTKLDGIESGAINQGSADSRYFIKGSNNQTTGNMFVHQQHNIGVDATISLAIGDRDTGFDWVQDGTLNFYADSTVVATMGKALAFDFKVNPTVNANSVYHDGNKSSYLASASEDGFMAKGDKSKLNGIASGAEVNQNAFNSVTVQGQSPLTADNKTDNFTFIAGEGMEIVSDATGMTITMQSALTDSFITKSGDTMTGNLSITKATPLLSLKGNSNDSSSIFMSEDSDNHGARLRYEGTLNEFQLIGRSSNTEVVGLSMHRSVSLNGLEYKGNTVWHAGNFTPTSKLSLSGGTMTGSLTLPAGSSNAGVHIGGTQLTDHSSGESFIINGNHGTLSVGTAYDWDKLAQFSFDPSVVGSSDQTLKIGQTKKNNANWTQGYTQFYTNGSTIMRLTPNSVELNGDLKGSVSGGAVNIQSDTGSLTIGSKNSNHAHFETDRDDFYFSKKILVDSGMISSYNEDFSLQTSESTRVTIKDSTGNVGIGTTSPDAKLHVAGSAYFTGTQIGLANDMDAITAFDATNISSPVGFYSGSDAIDMKLDARDNTAIRSGHFEADKTMYAGNKAGVGQFSIEYNSSEESLDFVFMG